MQQLDVAFSEVPQVRTVRYHAPLGRVVIDHDGTLDTRFAVRMLHTLEHTMGLSKRPFSAARERTPGEVAPIGRSTFALTVQSAAFAFGLLPRVGRFRGNHVNLGVAVSLLRGVPGLRESLERRLGRPIAEMMMGGIHGFARALNRAPLSAASELVSQGVSLRERMSRARTWEAREAELVDRPWVDPDRVATRTVPLRDGVVDSYSARALSLSLMSFVGAMVFSNSSARAATFLFAGLPRPAHRGRAAYATEIRRRLSQRGALVLRPDSVAKLDRIDTLILDARVLGEVLVRVEYVEPLDDGVSRETALQLVSDYLASTPGSPGAAENDAVGVFAGLSFHETSDDSHQRFISVRNGKDVIARVRLALRLAPESRELLASAQRSGLRVLVLDPTEEQLAVINGPDVEVIASRPEGLHVRDGQSDGSGVLMVGHPGTTGLSAADIGIVIQPPEHPVDWSADVLTPNTLAEANFLLEAVGPAKQVGTTSVWIARGEAVLSSVVTLGTPARIGLGRTFLASNLASLSAMLHGTMQAERVPAPAAGYAPRLAWYAMEVDEVMEVLGTSNRGLSTQQAHSRKRGDRRSHTRVIRYAAQELRNPLTPALMLGAGMSAVVGSTLDASLLAGTLLVDAGWSVSQRLRADNVVRSLSSDTEVRSRVMRDGELQRLPAQHVVDGDVLELVQGDVVPADARIVEASGFEVDESPITGESLPVPKRRDPAPGMSAADRWSVVFDGSTVTAGTARAVVTASGKATYMRRLGDDVHDSDNEPKDSIRHQLRSLSWKTLPAAGVAAAATTLSGLVRGRPVRSLLASGASLTVAAIPEGLTLLTTLAETSAAKRLAKHDVRVRNPRSIEALGRMTTLCLDKTGTLTRGELELSHVATPTSRYEPDDAFAASVLGAAAATGTKNDSAVDRLVHDAIGPAAVHALPEVVAAHPFSSRRGLAAAIVRVDDQLQLVVKGAPDRVLDDSEWKAAAAQHARSGARVLAVASRPWEGAVEDFAHLFDAPLALDELEPRGLIVLTDQPRPHARKTLDELRAAGIRTVMITGDQPETAAAVGARLGFSDARIPTGPSLDALSDTELEEVVVSSEIFARVEPNQKTRIVAALQRRGESVGMTGDGANDAPALTLADVGIAFGTNATLAAKHSADLAIPSDLDGLVDAVREGRAMWVSVREAVGVLVGGNLGEIAFCGATGLVSGRATLNARQLLLVNLFTDSLPAASIASARPNRKTADALLAQGPSTISERDLDQAIAWRAILTSSAATAAWTSARFTGTRARASTVALLSTVLSQLGQTVVATKGERGSLIACGISAATLLALIETPGLSHALRCRPLGLLGLAQAGVSAAAATGASVWVGQASEAVRDAPLRLRDKVRTKIEDTLSDPHSGVGRVWKRAKSLLGFADTSGARPNADTTDDPTNHNPTNKPNHTKGTTTHELDTSRRPMGPTQGKISDQMGQADG